jgi:hypothetical protein
VRFEYHNECFLPAISAVVSQDSAAAMAISVAWKKVETKVVLAYAESRGIEAEHLRLVDLCGPDGLLHPRLRAFVEKLPRGEKQSAERYARYKLEMCSHLQRAVNAAIEQLRNPCADPVTVGDAGDEFALDRHDEHPVLTEIYKTLPRETVFVPRKGRTQTETVTENGRLFYLACAEALKTCDATTAGEFLLHTRPIAQAIKRDCPVDKISPLMTVLERSRKQLGVALPKKQAQFKACDWPSPLREEFQNLEAVVKRPVSGEIHKAAASAGVKIRHRISPVTVDSVERAVGRLLAECWSEGPLSVRDILKTVKTTATGADGNEVNNYYNPFLTPFREREQARQSKGKGAGFDSCNFKKLVSDLKTLAAYNGIFELHQIVGEAFKSHIDLNRRAERKAEKKARIDRHDLDGWIESNWTSYERILKGKTFVRDKSKRSNRDSDTNMRFVLFYVVLVTLKVMGYRQRQIRDCRYGVNLRITGDSFTFTFGKDQTKNGKPLSFTADMRMCAITHGKLYQTLSMFHRYAFPYVQHHLAPRRPGDDVDPTGQFFVHLDGQGLFRCFHPLKNSSFCGWFSRACRRFLPGPELSKQASMLIHSHYLRGASMDTFILDQGGSMEAASKYYGDTVTVIEQAYRDRHAVQDASRDVILVNASLRQLGDLEVSKRGGAGGGMKHAEQSSADVSALLESNRLLTTQLAAALERISQMESALSQH